MQNLKQLVITGRGRSRMKSAFANANVIPMPLFQQVKEAVRREILDGTYGPHEKLPSERQMMEAFSVSRITVRLALADLQREGLIFKINGKGTFVTLPKAQFDVSTLRGFGESAAQIGQEAFTELVSVTTGLPSHGVAHQLLLPKGSQVTKFQRLRYLNREPLAFDVTYAPVELGERFRSADLQHRDLFDIVENDCGMTVASARVNVEAVLCDVELAAYLNVEQSSAALHIERCVHDATGAPILYENLFYRGDRFRFGLDIDRVHLGQPLGERG
ncbi:GntR family transcriptional regulator [Hydrocarboniclastica marina]|uniref:GntR family transcriptional regulator n=2 Tax=Hydrocarboniclastica marina TaxID=2259620 RepID=A0A4V1D8R6_9ALTE|nr:GntR family transcriptional regulator [Hydrocarboniclastica marina]